MPAADVAVVYTTNRISTIVDPQCTTNQTLVYTTNRISTIVDIEQKGDFIFVYTTNRILAYQKKCYFCIGYTNASH